AGMATGMFAPIDTPAAANQLTTNQNNTYWVAVDKDANNQPRYALGKDTQEVVKGGPDLVPVLAAVRKEVEKGFEELPARERLLNLRINLRGDKQLPIETIHDVQMALQQLENQINSEAA